MINGEPYFKYWRILVLDSWSETTTTIDSIRLFGRAEGPDLGANSVSNFASSGSPSFFNWTATLAADGTAHVGAEWRYPIAPRFLELVADGADCPKRLALECSNNLREWFQFGKTIDLPQGAGGGGGETCELLTLESILAHGVNLDFSASCSDYTAYEYESAGGCEMFVLRAHVYGNVSRFAKLFPTFETIIGNYQIYTGTWPDLVLFDEGYNVEIEPVYGVFIELGFAGDDYFTIAIQPVNTRDPINFSARATGVCS